MTHNNMEERIGKIFERIESSPQIMGITRSQYVGYNMEMALQNFERIGKARSPKFVIDEDNRQTIMQLIKWIEGDPTMLAIDPITGKVTQGRLNAGLYICGPTGTGKSWALEILNLFAELDNVKVRITGEVQALRWGSCRAEDIWEESLAEDKALHQYKNRKVLCIQDLGAEPDSAAVRMGSRREPMRQILEARGDRTDRITLITSNHRIMDEAIKTRYGERVQSRLCEMCNFLIIAGKDRRRL